MKLCEHGWTWWISTHLGDTMCFTMIVLTLFWFCLDHGDMFSCSLFLRTWQELVTTILSLIILSFLEIQNPEKKSWNLGVYLLFSENDGLWRQTPETPKNPCFWKGNWMSRVFLRSEGWVEQSESCHWKHWKSPAKIPQISANPKMAESEHFQILGVWGWPHLAVSHCQMTWNTWNSWNHWKAETPHFFSREWISRLFRIDALNQNDVYIQWRFPKVGIPQIIQNSMILVWKAMVTAGDSPEISIHSGPDTSCGSLDDPHGFPMCHGPLDGGYPHDKTHTSTMFPSVSRHFGGPRWQDPPPLELEVFLFQRSITRLKKSREIERNLRVSQSWPIM